jgi:hypothetical protein
VQDSRELIDGINAEEEKRCAETYRFMEEQKIKKALAPAQWEELKSDLATHCEKIRRSSPVDIVVEEDGPDRISLTNTRNGKSLSMSYNANVPCIQYVVPGRSGHFGFRVAADGASIQLMDGPVPKQTRDVAFDAIKRITAK